MAFTFGIRHHLLPAVAVVSGLPAFGYTFFPFMFHKDSYCRLNCVLPKRYVEVLTFGICECDLIWKEVLCRCNQIKMRLYWSRVGL